MVKLHPCEFPINQLELSHLIAFEDPSSTYTVRSVTDHLTVYMSSYCTRDVMRAIANFEALIGPYNSRIEVEWFSRSSNKRVQYNTITARVRLHR